MVVGLIRNSMEIGCRLVESTGDQEADKILNLPKGKYLEVLTAKDYQPLYIPFEEFQSLYDEAKREVDAVPQEPKMETAEVVSLESRSQQKPRFSKVIDFLSQRIGIDEDDLDKEGELVIRSDWGLFLELPWEYLVEKQIFVIRKFARENLVTDRREENNLLLLTSHARESTEKDLKRVMDEEIGAIYDALHFLRKSNQTTFRVEKILLLKHATREALGKIDWESFNLIHFVMHGDQGGRLCLESKDRDRYKTPDPLSVDDLLEILSGKNFTLIFLSLCYSGGEASEGDSLAFRLTRTGVSRYVIGYSNAVGEMSARNFSSIFYELLTTGDDIQTVYKESLKRYYKTKPSRYLPLLYVA
jgi:hypothetical protein